MEYKISQIVSATGVPKSTILYYIREGLLPEAKKIKSNVHRYNDEHIELIKYIKYMKEEMGSSNQQIKTALEKKNQSFSSSYSMLAPLMQTLSGISTQTHHYTKEEFLKEFSLERTFIERLLEEEILLPLSPDDFTQKEASLARLIQNFEAIGIEYEIIKKYIAHAKELCALESQLQKKLCTSTTDENFSTLWKIMFETLFTAKEYLFNRHTHKVLFDVLKEEIKQKD